MENASKALLIAGAILVCILLIGVGMLVYQSIQGTIAEGVSQMSAQEREMFNSQFTQYAGNRVNGASVKALLNKVNSNNVANEDITGKIVRVTGSIVNGTVTQVDAETINNLNTARNYTVVCTDSETGRGNDSDGLISLITITANT